MTGALVQRHLHPEVMGKDEELSDESLLERFLSGADLDSQEAFRALVVRHGPMVLGICRHVLTEHHDSEDAFQATFLVLARRGAAIRNRRVLAGWLHGVAHRIAIKARASAARRRTLEMKGTAMSPQAIESNGPDEAAAWNELRPVLHDEVHRLPEKYRLPVILSYLEGKTNEEVAELLHWPVGTVKGRLSRARDLLRSRLMRRGLCLSAAFLLTALDQGRVFAEVVPLDLVRRTVRLAGRFGPRSAPPGPAAPEAEAEPALESDLPARVESLTEASRERRSRGRRVLRGLLLSIFVFSLSAGIPLAAFNPGGISSFVPRSVSRFQAALSAYIPSFLKGTGERCR
ncbi:MAG: RNA polymerase sigma factor [Isosphaerales bacterium]